MIPVIVFTIFSFLLQGIMSNFLNYTLYNPSILSTIYTLVTLIILSKYFDDERKYYLIVFIFGLLYDLVYTNTFILNAILFTSICMIARIVSKNFSDSIITINIITLLSIILYHTLSFIILSIISYNKYNIRLLLLISSHSIIMTILFTTLIYYLSNYIFTKFEIKLIR